MQGREENQKNVVKQHAVFGLKWIFISYGRLWRTEFNGGQFVV